MGPFSNHRLKHYVSWVHIICLTKLLQVYAVKTGIGCHYQVTAQELFKFLHDDVSNIPFYIYGNMHNHETDLFLYGTIFL